MVLSHLIGDLNLINPRRVYSVSSSDFGVATFSDSLVICCTLLLLLSLYALRLITVTPLRLIGLFSGCVASSTVTACTWWCMIDSSQLLALFWYFLNKLNYVKLIYTFKFRKCSDLFPEMCDFLRPQESNQQNILWNTTVSDEKRKWNFFSCNFFPLNYQHK